MNSTEEKYFRYVLWHHYEYLGFLLLLKAPVYLRIKSYSSDRCKPFEIVLVLSFFPVSEVYVFLLKIVLLSWPFPPNYNLLYHEIKILSKKFPYSNNFSNRCITFSMMRRNTIFQQSFLMKFCSIACIFIPSVLRILTR